MKVIKDGNKGDPRKWKGQVTCKTPPNKREAGCGAVLQITKEDLILLCESGGNSRRYYAGMRCPQCGALVQVVDLPQPVSDALYEDDALVNPRFDCCP